jgi:hypothetical protein
VIVTVLSARVIMHTYRFHLKLSHALIRCTGALFLLPNTSQLGGKGTSACLRNNEHIATRQLGLDSFVYKRLRELELMDLDPARAGAGRAIGLSRNEHAASQSLTIESVRPHSANLCLASHLLNGPPPGRFMSSSRTGSNTEGKPLHVPVPPAICANESEHRLSSSVTKLI